MARGMRRTALVSYTSLRVRFIKLSHATRCPLNVDPFLSSTSFNIEVCEEEGVHVWCVEAIATSRET